MRSWPHPQIPDAPGASVPLRLHDTADGAVRPVEFPPEGPVGVYVCGITPYDSTHLGHAATYLTFDLVNRVLLDAGRRIRFVENVTDVDDPLFERAERDGVDWRELGDDQTDLFRSDMTALRVIPPAELVGATEAIDEVIALISRLLERGAAYVVEDGEHPDVYARVDATARFGYESNCDRAEMERLFAERGGDPDRPGKRDPLDALLWRAHREGEPAWDSPFGPGRPGWHVECAAIAARRLGPVFAIQGGGEDLAFPHHEYSAAHVEAAYDVPRMAGHYCHAGMISLDGVKMSKSLGNLVFVSRLTAAGHEPDAIRLGVYADHYRRCRDWSDEVLAAAEYRLDRWRRAAVAARDMAAAEAVVGAMRARLSDDLDTPGALAALDWWAADELAAADDCGDGRAFGPAGALVAVAVDALLGVRLHHAHDEAAARG